MRPRLIATKLKCIATGALVAICALSAVALSAQPASDPLTRPITGEAGAGWLSAPSTAKVFGKTSFIGSKRLRQAVIDTGKGLVLIDTGLPEGLPALRAQLAELGLDVRSIRTILVTEPHYDHAGAAAALVRESGAKVFASAYTARAMRAGLSDSDDPQFSSLIPYAPTDRVHVLHHGSRLRLGSITITARAMPGHTPGSMGFSWRECEGRDCRRMVFAASLNPLATGDFRYSLHQPLVSAMRRTLARLETMPCDILLTNHPEHSGANERMAEALRGDRDAFASPGACRSMAEKYRELLERALRK